MWHHLRTQRPHHDHSGIAIFKQPLGPIAMEERGPPLVIDIAEKPTWKEIRARLQTASALAPSRLEETDSSHERECSTTSVTPVVTLNAAVTLGRAMVQSATPTPKASPASLKNPASFKSPHKQALERSTTCEVDRVSRSSSCDFFPNSSLEPLCLPNGCNRTFF